MSKLIPMDEAAQLLGLSVERLTELRSSNEIFGYRDGSNWKFKMSELERVADEMGITITGGGDALSDSSIGFDLTDSAKSLIDEDSDSMSGSSSSLSGFMDSADFTEDSSVELFQSPLGAEDKADNDSGIDLDDDEGISLADSGRLKQGTSKDKAASSSGLNLGGSDILDSGENVLDDDEQLSFGASSLRLASESSKKLQLEGSSDDILDDEPDPAKSPSDTGKMLGDENDDDLLMSEEDLFSDDLSLADSASFEDSVELDSDFEDSDLVLDDSDSSTEITLEGNESGINLSANESGISLADEPLELGGSDIDALELPEDEDMIVLEDAAGPDQAAMMQEDDFNLTPLEESMDEEDSSGSQVIALEDSEIYADDSEGSVLGEEEFEAQPAMLDDTMGGDLGGYDPMDQGQMMVPAGAAALPEAPYSLWQVISLGLVTALLMAGSMVAYSLAQNMWMPSDQVVDSSVLNFFLKLTGMN